MVLYMFYIAELHCQGIVFLRQPCRDVVMLDKKSFHAAVGPETNGKSGHLSERNACWKICNEDFPASSTQRRRSCELWTLEVHHTSKQVLWEAARSIRSRRRW